MSDQCRPSDFFATEIDPDFLCPIGQGVLPFQRGMSLSSPCGHVFCAQCIAEAIKRKPECPIDRLPLQREQLVQIPIPMTGILRKFVAKCDFFSEGCCWTGAWETLATHLGSCEFFPVECKFKQHGCEFSSARGHIHEHEKSCDFRMVSLFQSTVKPELDSLKLQVAQMQEQQKIQSATISSLSDELERSRTLISTQQCEITKLKQALKNLEKKPEVSGARSPSLIALIPMEAEASTFPGANQVLLWCGGQELSLLYDSLIHRQSNQKFHELCDDVGPMVHLYETERGTVGAFSSVPWSSKQNENSPDPKAFLFRLASPGSMGPIKFSQLNRQSHAISFLSNRASLFGLGRPGDGFDLLVDLDESYLFSTLSRQAKNTFGPDVAVEDELPLVGTDSYVTVVRARMFAVFF